MSTRLESEQEARDVRIAAEERDRAATARRRRGKMLGAALLAAAIVVVAAVIVSQGHSARSAKPGTSTQSASLFGGIPQKGITLGDPSAPVTMTEFADLQCPFCQQFTLGQLPTLVRAYVRTGKVKIVFRNLTFIGPDSVRAARFAAAAGLQDKLFGFMDRFYANQQTENSGYVTDAFLRKVASQVPGLDVNMAFRDARLPSIDAQLNQAQQAADRAGVDSTPTFVLNGRAYDASQILGALQTAA